MIGFIVHRLNTFDLDRGETCLKASAIRRNDNIEEGSRARNGRKIDVIGSMKCGGWEVLIIEAATIFDKPHSMKGRTDRHKLAEMMKDMLDNVLLHGLNGITANDVGTIFTVGVQIIGKCMIYISKPIKFNILNVNIGTNINVYAINLSHEGVYRFKEMFNFRVPTNERESLFLRPAIVGFLRIKVSLFISEHICNSPYLTFKRIFRNLFASS
jgi:hypothetical protein